MICALYNSILSVHNNYFTGLNAGVILYAVKFGEMDHVKNR